MATEREELEHSINLAYELAYQKIDQTPGWGGLATDVVYAEPLAKAAPELLEACEMAYQVASAIAVGLVKTEHIDWPRLEQSLADAIANATATQPPSQPTTITPQ